MRTMMWRAGKWAFDNVGNALLQPPQRRCFGQVTCHAARSSRRLALTFDDGPSAPSTDRTLDALAELGVPATFFCVGEMVTWHPQIVARAFSEGHEIGNHSMYHSRRQALEFGRDAHIVSAQQAIEAAIGRRPALYRPAWGWTTPWELRRAQRLGMTVVGWDVYPDDWRVPENPAATTTAQIVDGAQGGSIILMHDATAGLAQCTKTETARAVTEVVGRLRDRGYEFVHVSTLLEVPAYLDQVSAAA